MDRGERFKRRALRRGYKVDQVDDFLERVEATLAGEDIDDPVTPDDVRDVIFKTRWGGYDEWHVDMELDRLERQLEEFVDDPGSIRGSSGFPALGQRKSLALPAGSSANRDTELFDAATDTDEDIDTSRVYRSSATHDDVSDNFGDLADAGRGPRYGVSSAPPAPSGASATYADGLPRRATPPPTSGSPARARSVPSPGSANEQTQIRTRTRRPVPSAPPETPVRGTPATSPITGDRYPSDGDETEFDIPPVPSPVPPVAPARPAYADPYAPRHGKTEMTVEIPTYGEGLSPFTHEDKARVGELKTTFKLRRFGSGYEPSQVERLWDAIAAAMDGQASAKVTDADFDPGQFALVQGGYFEQEVDLALGEMRELFHHRMGEG